MKRWQRLIALSLLGACSPASSSRPPPPTGAAPVVSAQPPPGTYQSAGLEVVVAVAPENHALQFEFGMSPTEGTPAQTGEFQVKLASSATLYVMARDPRGKRWGPYVFDYRLASASASPACDLQASDSLINGRQQVAVKLTAAFATALDKLEFFVDEQVRTISHAELTNGAFQTQVGPWPDGGIHILKCAITGQRSAAAQLEIAVDADPPFAAWNVESGTQGRPDWPADLALTAGDAYAGLAGVHFCAAGTCTSAYGVGDGLFKHATAFTTGTQFSADVTAFVTDRVGNMRTLPAITYGIWFAEPPPGETLPIQSTTATSFSLTAALEKLGRDSGIAEVWRVGQPSLPFSPGNVPLVPGWNDFAYRRNGRTAFESFAVYRLGFSTAFPTTGDTWLAYASNATIPAMQAGFLGPVTGEAFHSAWWDIPHVFFVRDLDGDKRWGTHDELWAPLADPFSGPWFATAAPVEATLERHTLTGFEIDQTYFISCADCAPGGSLFFEERNSWHDYPSTHVERAGTGHLDLQTGMEVTLATSARPVCIFYWDENGSTALDGNEPRAFSNCAAGPVVLGRRQGTLAAQVAAGQVAVSGLQYGGGAWAVVELEAAGQVIFERLLGYASDADGLGNGLLAIPPQLPRELPFSLRIADDTQELRAPMPPVAMAPGVTVPVSVVDELGVPVAAGVVLTGPLGVAGGLFEGAATPVAIPVPAAHGSWQALALRSGYLTETTTIAAEGGTIRLLSYGVTGRIDGQIVDRFGLPVPFANITWSAPPYYSETVAGANGRFTLRALGSGALTAVGGSDQVGGQIASRNLTIAQGEHIASFDLQFSLPGSFQGRGLLGDAADPQLTGPPELPQPHVVLASPYYHATGLNTGRSTYFAGTFAREFVFPGELPAFQFPGPYALIENPPSLGGALPGRFACGDRWQRTGVGGSLVVDGPCWAWFASDQQQTYFLGAPTLPGGLDDQARFGNVTVTIAGDYNGTLRLTDLMFGRTITMRMQDGRAEAIIPAGEYLVGLPHGQPLYDSFEKPARLKVIAGDTLDVQLWMP